MSNMQKAILIILGIFAMIALYFYTEPDRKQYNKYMCANYGYYEDCKTPLKPEDRLK